MTRLFKLLAGHRYVNESLLGLVFVLIPFALCFLPLVSHPAEVITGPQRGGFNDLVLAFMRFRDMPTTIAEQYQQFPGWNPYMQLGMPLHGNPQASLFYLPNWIFYFFSSESAISWVMILHHLWAALGTFLLCRAYRLRRAAAVLGAIVFMAAPYYVAHTGEGHYNTVCLIAWIPWAFLFYERLIRRKPYSSAGLITVLTMCFFCGHAQEFFYLVLLLTICALWTIAHRLIKRDLASSAQLVLAWAVVGVSTLGLAAIELVPNSQYASQSVRSDGIDAQQASAVSLGLGNLKQLAGPTLLGGPVTYDGPGDFYWETLCYFGIAPLLLAVAGIIAGARTAPWSYKYIVIALLGACFAFGYPNPVFSFCYDWIPGFDFFRAPSRSLFFVAFCVAILAALGTDRLAIYFDRLLMRFTTQRKWIVSGTIVAAVLLVAFLVMGYRGVAPAEPAHNLLAICLVTGVVCCLAAFFGRRHLQGNFACILLIGIVTCDLAMHANWILVTMPARGLRQNSLVLKVIHARTNSHDRILADFRLVSDRESCGAGVCRMRGYEPVPLRPYAEMIEAMQDGTTEELDILGFQSLQLNKMHKPLIDLAGIRLAICSKPQRVADTEWQLVDAGFIPREVTLGEWEAKQQRFFVYENQTALPRAFVVGDSQQLGDSDHRIELLRESNFRSAVLLEDEVPLSDARARFAAANIVFYTPNEVVVEAELDAPGYLVLSDLWYPGWHAEVDGVEKPVLRANGAYRAISLEGGRHRVRFFYRSDRNRLAGGITLATAILLVCGQFCYRRRSRRIPPSTPDCD